MANTLPTDLKYSASHEWVRTNNDGSLTLGVTQFAADQLGDVVFVELPELGRRIEVEEGISVVESVKAASDIYAVVAGEVVEVNEALEESPELINDEPFTGGWICRIQPADDSAIRSLMDANDYAGVLAEA